jgi:Asp-tRNA(Asn)/Glu-tRNA(Gln) amidotransferase A subunit family amidase
VSRTASQLDVEQALEAALARAELARNGGAFSVLLDGDARRDAARARRELATGRPARPLEGSTLAVKDLVAVRGQRIGAGSASRAGAPPESEDAAIVAALRSSGAVVVGLAALHELAFGSTGVNEYEGTPRNPFGSGLIPGGSSSGSAVAVATGAASLAIGTDTGGSVRVPAALCGVVGFKPAFGEYSLGGVLPLAPSLDHAGLLGSSVEIVRRAHWSTIPVSGAARLATHPW